MHLSATLIEKCPLRFTPAGIAVLDVKLHHVSSVYEAGHERHLEFMVQGIAFADCALKLNEMDDGSEIEIDGFIAPRSMKTQKLIVHITEFKFRS